MCVCVCVWRGWSANNSSACECNVSSSSAAVALCCGLGRWCLLHYACQVISWRTDGSGQAADHILKLVALWSTVCAFVSHYPRPNAHAFCSSCTPEKIFHLIERCAVIKLSGVGYQGRVIWDLSMPHSTLGRHLACDAPTSKVYSPTGRKLLYCIHLMRSTATSYCCFTG